MNCDYVVLVTVINRQGLHETIPFYASSAYNAGVLCMSIRKGGELVVMDAGLARLCQVRSVEWCRL
jgi:hypothetical protein